MERIKKKYHSIQFTEKLYEINAEEMRGILLGNYYSLVGENLYKKIEKVNTGEGNLLEYYYVKIIEIEKIDEKVIEDSLSDFDKGSLVHNTTMFFIDNFDEKAKKVVLDYIKDFIAFSSVYTFKTKVGYAPLVYEKSSGILYFYNQKSFFKKQFAQSIGQIFDLI